MLVTFEGLDCAGKSSIIREVAAGLRSTLNGRVVQLPDVSHAPTGRRLHEVYQSDELFGQGIADTTVISRCMSAAADLFYFDAAIIAPMVAAGELVLKERHIDTLFAHEAPVLTKRCGWTEQRAWEWLSKVFEPLQVRPTLTIMVDTPLKDRERRLRQRAEAAGREYGPDDAVVNRETFRIRAESYERLRLKDASRWVSLDNPDGALAHSVACAIEEILDRRTNAGHTEKSVTFPPGGP